MSDIDTIRERHTLMRGQSTGASKGICYRCNAQWPCDTRVVLDALDVAERQRDTYGDTLQTAHEDRKRYRAAIIQAAKEAERE